MVLLSKLAVIGTVMVCVFPLLTQAATNAPEHIVVTGTRSEQPSVQIPASIQILRADQIQASGASNLLQVLNAQAGIQINDAIGNAGRGASVSMRGFGENNISNILVMVDGRKLNNPVLAGPDLASIAIKDIERVEIIQGSAGSLYGDQATGGVINIITKRPQAMSARLEASRGTDDLVATRGSVAQGFDNGLSYRISGEKKTADNYRDNNESSYNNVLTNIEYEKQWFKIFAEALFVEDELNFPGSLSLDDIRQNRRQTNTPGNYSHRDTQVYRMGGEVKFLSNWVLVAEYTDREVQSDGSYFGDLLRVKSLSPRLLGELDIANAKVLITSGIDLQESEYSSSFSGDSDQDIYDIYAQAVIPLVDAVSITVGGRLSELEEQSRAAGTGHDDVTVFQVGASYHVSDDTKLFLRRDGGFRWATLDENSFSDVAAGEFLEPQESTSWELGVEHRIDTLQLSAMSYLLDIDNEIYYDPSFMTPGGFFPGANSNLEQSTRKGIVLGAGWQVSERVNLKLNYSRVDAEVGAGEAEGKTIPFVAEQTANFIVLYQFNNHFSLYYDVQYTGNRFRSGDVTNVNGELGGYTLHNANVRWDYQNFYVNVRAGNFTGKEYERLTLVGSAYPSPEEQFELKVGYNF